MSNEPKKNKKQQLPPTDETPEVYAVTRSEEGDYKLTRKNFFKLVGAVGAGLATGSLAGAKPVPCTKDSKKPVGNLMLVKSSSALPVAYDSVSSLAISADGMILASAGDYGCVKLWDLQCNLLTKVVKTKSWYAAVALDPTGRFIASGGEDGVVRLGKMPTASGEYKLRVGSAVKSLAFSSTGEMLAAASGTSITFWGSVKRKMLRTIAASARSLAFGPADATLASADGSSTAKLWNSADGSLIQTFGLAPAAYGNGINAVAFDPISGILATGHYGALANGENDNCVRFWNVSNGEVLKRLSFEHSSERVSCVAFAANGSKVAAGSEHGTIKVWDSASGLLLHSLSAHTKWVNSVIFTPDGRRLISGGGDGLIIIWDLEGSGQRWVLFDPSEFDAQVRASTYKECAQTTQVGVCTCDMVCTCNSIWVASGQSLPNGALCICNTIMLGPLNKGGNGRKTTSYRSTTEVVQGGVCVCDSICTCDKICSCNTVSTGGGGGGGGGGYYGGGYSYYVTYWYPN